MKNTELVKTVLKDTFPVFAGYIMLGIGFGVLMAINGYGIIMPVIMSICLYAGSLQYAAVGLFTGGASCLTVAITTAAIQIRHLFYGISMLDKYKGIGPKKIYLALALTDETYSLLCTTDKDEKYCTLVSIFDHSYWITGTLIGAVLGNVIDFNSQGIDFVLTALFVTIFTEQWIENKGHFPAIVGIAASVGMLLIFGPDKFLIPAMIVIAACLLLPIRKEAPND